MVNAQQEEVVKRFVDYSEFNIELTNQSSLRTESEISLGSFRVQTNNDIFLGKKFFEEYMAKFDLNIQKRNGLIRMDAINSYTFS